MPVVSDYLTLEEIRAQLDVPIDQVRAFADRTEVRAHCGAVPNPRTRGVMWPPEAVPVLKHLLDMRQAGRLEPKNVLSYLQDLQQSPGDFAGNSLRNGSAIGLLRRSPDSIGALVPAAADAIALLERIAAAQGSQTQDRLLTVSEARVEFGLSLRAALSLSILVDRRRRIKLSAVQTYIRSL